MQLKLERVDFEQLRALGLVVGAIRVATRIVQFDEHMLGAVKRVARHVRLAQLQVDVEPHALADFTPARGHRFIIFEGEM